MTDQKSGTRSSVGLLDIATHVPGLLMDAPVILRGALTGFLARPSAKTSIGKVFQERAARYADQVFIKFGDEQLTYRRGQRDRRTATPRCWPRAASATATSSGSCGATRRSRCC